MAINAASSPTSHRNFIDDTFSYFWLAVKL
jgi:hypothetical protein